jgi:hypothetical protein
MIELLHRALPLIAIWIWGSGPLRASGGQESIGGADGRRIPGQLEGDAEGGFRFVPDGGGTPLPLEAAGPIVFEGPGPRPSAVPPPFRVRLGPGLELSGTLVGLDADTLAFAAGCGTGPLTIRREGVLALVQRPGEALVLAEDFGRLDPSQWTTEGRPEIAELPGGDGTKALRLPAGGSSVTAHLSEPLDAGWVEVAYEDDARSVPNQRWVVELRFRSTGGIETVQVLPGWADGSLGVQCRGAEGPTLAVQRLVRTRGRHRLAIRFGPERTDVALDGDELAHGDPPPGPLVELRLATVAGTMPAPDGLAASVTELRVARLALAASRPDVDPSQDEIRLVTGDQVFGEARKADPDGATLVLDGRSVRYRWSDAAGLYFRRAPAPSEPLEGQWVLLSWRPDPRPSSGEPDRVEGVLVGATPEAVAVEVPYAGRLTVPRGQLAELVPLGRVWRTILDPTSHHLGSSIVPELDPPQPAGSSLELTFDLDAVPPGAASIGLDVLQVVGVDGNLDFSPLVRRGELLTSVLLNGRPFDNLNRHVTTRNDAPLRIRLPVPPGLLRQGRNVLRFEQAGLKDDPEKLDNLGLARIALEVDPARPNGEAPQP